MTFVVMQNGTANYADMQDAGKPMANYGTKYVNSKNLFIFSFICRESDET